MADKYIRVSEKLHKRIKLQSYSGHYSMKEIVEQCVWPMFKKNERRKPHDKSKR